MATLSLRQYERSTPHAFRAVDAKATLPINATWFRSPARGASVKVPRPSVCCMESSVFAIVSQLQIVNPIIQPITIDMVNDLVPVQPTTKVLFHDQTVLKDAPAVVIQHDVSVPRYEPPTRPIRVLRACQSNRFSTCARAIRTTSLTRYLRWGARKDGSASKAHQRHVLNSNYVRRHLSSQRLPVAPMGAKAVGVVAAPRLDGERLTARLADCGILRLHWMILTSDAMPGSVTALLRLPVFRKYIRKTEAYHR